MNVTPISCNYSSIKNNSVNKQNTSISFCSGKNTVAKKAKENAGCTFNVLLAAAPAPLAILSMILTNKNNKIARMTIGLQSEYEEHYGSFKIFEEKACEMNKFLNKHTKNEEYTQFVKEAINFLRTNYEQNQYAYDRLEQFNGSNHDENKLNWLRFMDTIQESAQAAVSKNCKGIDLKELNQDIQLSREIMRW